MPRRPKTTPDHLVGTTEIFKLATLLQKAQGLCVSATALDKDVLDRMIEKIQGIIKNIRDQQDKILKDQTDKKEITPVVIPEFDFKSQNLILDSVARNPVK